MSVPDALLPTADDFFTRFPIFEDADEDQITALIAEASRSVDEDWVSTDIKPAILYLTAHLFATDNSEEGGEVNIGPTPGAVASESFGPMSVSYATNAGSGTLSSSDQYGSTEYGRRFLIYLRDNKSGPVVI